MPFQVPLLCLLVSLRRSSAGGGLPTAATVAAPPDGAAVIVVPPWPGVAGLGGIKQAVNKQLPLFVTPCETVCPCLDELPAELPASASACCVWKAGVLEKEPRPNGCSLSLTLTDEPTPARIRSHLAAKRKTGGNADVVLGVYGLDWTVSGVNATQRCAECVAGGFVYWSGESVAANPSRIFVGANRAASATRFVSDVHASVEECENRYEVDEWWSAEWPALREWVLAELQAEGGEAVLEMQLGLLDSWAVRRRTSSKEEL